MSNKNKSWIHTLQVELKPEDNKQLKEMLLKSNLVMIVENNSGMFMFDKDTDEFVKIESDVKAR